MNDALLAMSFAMKHTFSDTDTATSTTTRILRALYAHAATWLDHDGQCARRMLEAGPDVPLPVLADALEDAGCDVPELLADARAHGVDGVCGEWVRVALREFAWMTAPGYYYPSANLILFGKPPATNGQLFGVHRPALVAWPLHRYSFHPIDVTNSASRGMVEYSGETWEFTVAKPHGSNYSDFYLSFPDEYSLMLDATLFGANSNRWCEWHAERLLVGRASCRITARHLMTDVQARTVGGPVRRLEGLPGGLPVPLSTTSLPS